MAHGRPAKRRRLTPPADDSAVSETIQASDLLSRVAGWDLEQGYEQRSRNKTKSAEPTRLPRKTADGKLYAAKEERDSENEADSVLGSDTDGEEHTRTETPPTDDVDNKPEISLQQQITDTKEEIARLAGLLNEDPEEHAGSFKKLAQITPSDAHPAIQKIGLAAQAAVYKDVIPGYRIRAYKDEDLGNKVSKEIRQTRQYEQALIMGYQSYIKRLTSITKDKELRESSLGTVALSCACSLLLSVPHFNCRTELLNILVHNLSWREATSNFTKSLATLEQFFRDDEDGAPSLEAVNVLSKMLKAKDYRVREEVLNTFMYLRLLTELSVKGSTTQTEKVQDDGAKLHGRKVKREKHQYRSKKERKLLRERKAVEKDMREANAAVDYEAREKMQSETLKVVFVVYFRILKARIPDLMGAVLEGLAKYAHLINQEFFGDILEALKDIVNQAEAAVSGIEVEEESTDENINPMDNSSRDFTRESLLSTQTAFTLLSHQDTLKSASALHLDLSFFTNNVYRSLYAITLSPDLELGPKSIHLPDPNSAINARLNQNRVNIATPVLLLSRALHSILLSPVAGANTSPLLLATFTKRLLTVLLQTPEKSSLSLLSLLLALSQKHGRKVEALWYSDERKGDGVYNGASESLDGTKVWSIGSGVWEGELLRRHWCPEVRERWMEVEKSIKSLSK